MRFWWVLGLVSVVVILVAVVAGVAWAEGEGIWARHMHMGGATHECADCHNGVRAPEPPVLRGRYAHMGGPKHQCVDCHDGVKAPILPIPEGFTSCSDCHPTK